MKSDISLEMPVDPNLPPDAPAGLSYYTIAIWDQVVTRETIHDWKNRLDELAAGLKQLDEFRNLEKTICGDPPPRAKLPTRHPLLRDYLALYNKVLRTLRKLAGISGGLHEYEFSITELIHILMDRRPASEHPKFHTGQKRRGRTKY